jgi:hypothetical protein
MYVFNNENVVCLGADQLHLFILMYVWNGLYNNSEQYTL